MNKIVDDMRRFMEIAAPINNTNPINTIKITVPRSKVLIFRELLAELPWDSQPTSTREEHAIFHKSFYITGTTECINNVMGGVMSNRLGPITVNSTNYKPSFIQSFWDMWLTNTTPEENIILLKVSDDDISLKNISNWTRLKLNVKFQFQHYLRLNLPSEKEAALNNFVRELLWQLGVVSPLLQPLLNASSKLTPAERKDIDEREKFLYNERVTRHALEFLAAHCGEPGIDAALEAALEAVNNPKSDIDLRYVLPRH